jgi:putative oxidoreductase
MTSRLDFQRFTRYSPAVLSVFRVVFGLLFAIHGSITVLGFPSAPAHAVEVGAWPGWWAGLIELVTGLLIAAGLFTRPAAFIASGQMAVAYFWMHQPHALWPIGDPPSGNGGEPAILYCFAFLLLVFLGPGPYSVDARRGGVRVRRR